MKAVEICKKPLNVLNQRSIYQRELSYIIRYLPNYDLVLVLHEFKVLNLFLPKS